MRRTSLWVAFATVAVWPSVVRAVEVDEMHFEGARVTVVRVDLREDALELFLGDDSGAPLKSFQRLRRHVEAKGRSLVFAMNAGMYEPDYSPVGLHIAEGREQSPLNRRAGWENFYLKPLPEKAGPKRP